MNLSAMKNLMEGKEKEGKMSKKAAKTGIMKKLVKKASGKADASNRM